MLHRITNDEAASALEAALAVIHEAQAKERDGCLISVRAINMWAVKARLCELKYSVTFCTLASDRAIFNVEW